MEEHINMQQSENEKFLSAILDKALQKMNILSNNNLVLETQLKFAQDKIKELEKTNASTFESPDTN